MNWQKMHLGNTLRLATVPALYKSDAYIGGKFSTATDAIFTERTWTTTTHGTYTVNYCRVNQGLISQDWSFVCQRWQNIGALSCF